jgi:hypothetical protein
MTASTPATQSQSQALIDRLYAACSLELPETLLSDVSQAAKEIEHLQSLVHPFMNLCEYAQHRSGCNADEHRSCTCGYDKAWLRVFA